MFVLKGENTHTESAPETVLFYGGEFGYAFSNFAAFSVEWNGRMWQTSEHAFQAAGFDDETIVEEIAAATSAHDALMLAIKHQADMRDGWEEEKRTVMKEICRAKLSQHPYIEKSLRKTGSATLIEDSPKDECWGRGANWQGKNWLGEIWMELRAELAA